MAYRTITGTYKKFYDDEPFAFGILKFTLDKEDWDSGAIYPAQDVDVTIILDQNGQPPLGFSLWVNDSSANGSQYTVTEKTNSDSEGNQWIFILPAGGGSINIQDLRAAAIPPTP